MQLQIIQQKIFEIRGQKVMLDFDLAALYEVETKALNQAVKRNLERFPQDFMFRLTQEEWNNMRSQIVTAYKEVIESQQENRSQNVTASQSKRNTYVRPYAFNEHGVTMLASVLRSERSVQMNIAIVRAFIALRKFAIQYNDLIEQLNELKDRIGAHDAQLNLIYDAIENMLDEKAEEKRLHERKRIGFKQ